MECREEGRVEEEKELEEEEEEESWSSDSEMGEDWLDSREGPEGDGTSAAFSLASFRRPNAHGGVLSRPLQPLSNCNQKYTSHIHASPLEEWEGRMNVGISNTVTTAIRDCS